MLHADVSAPSTKPNPVLHAASQQLQFKREAKSGERWR